MDLLRTLPALLLLISTALAASYVADASADNTAAQATYARAPQSEAAP